MSTYPAVLRVLTGAILAAMTLVATPAQAATVGATTPASVGDIASLDTAVPNGGFEEELVDGAIPGWTLARGSWDDFTRDTSLATEASASIRLTDTAGAARHSIISAKVAVQPNSAYTVSADLFKRLGGIVMYARLYTEDGLQISAPGQNFFTTTADTWESISLDVATPSDAAFLAVDLYVGTTPVDVNIDNLRVTVPEEPGPFETIQNPSFEMTRQPAGGIPYWELTHGSWDNMLQDSTRSSDADNSLRIYNPTSEGRYGVRSSHQLVDPDVSYLLKADINRTVGGIAAYIRYFDASGELIDSYGANFFNTPEGSWAPLYVSGRAPAGAATLAAEFYIGHNEVDVNIDNVEIVLDPRADITTRTFPVPMTALETHAGDIARMPDGTYRTWVVAGGNEEAFLYEIDTLSREILNEWPLPNVARSYYARVDDSGTVWASAFNTGGGARMFMLPFGAEEPIDVGRFSDDGRILYQFDVGDDGAVYVGSYEGMASGPLPPARVGKYDPADGTWHDFGILDPALTYINTVSVVGEYAYVGAGTEWAGFYKVHTETGAKETLDTPAQVSDCARVYESDAVGDLIFVRFSNCEGVPSKGWVYDTAEEEWIAEISGFQGQLVSEPDSEGNVYLVASNHLSSFNLETHEITALYRIQKESGTRGIVNIDGTGLIAGFTGDGYQWTYDRNSGESTFERVEGLMRSKIPPHAMAEGPDGRVYVTGYFQGGVAAYDPRDDSYEFWEFPPQAERIVAHDGKLYLGTYTGAELWEFDPAQEWKQFENPRRVVDLRGISQDRPFGIASAGDYVAMGTVPDYGKLGGTLALYNPGTETVETFEHLIEDQSIVALTYEDGIVYGATSVWGGLGSTPSQPNARVFAFDVADRELLWSVEPYAGERAFTDITVDEFGSLWVVSPGKVLKLDATGNRVAHTEIVSYDWEAQKAVWFGGAIDYDPTEKRIYGTTSRTLFSLDVETLENNAFGVAGEYFVMHTDGSRYYTVGYDLIQERSGARSYAPLGSVGEVLFKDEPGVDADRVVIPSTEGAQYSINGEEVAAGSHAASGRVEVRVTAQEGFLMPRGARSSWEFEFSAQSEPEEPGEDEPALSLDIHTVRAGASLLVGGTGFSAGEELGLELRSDPVLLTDVTADADGALSVTVDVPADTIPGSHTLVAVGADGDLASVALTVLAADGDDGSDGSDGSVGSGGDGASGGDGSADDLADTGAESLVFLGLAALFLVAGAVLVATRRRQPAE